MIKEENISPYFSRQDSCRYNPFPNDRFGTYPMKTPVDENFRVAQLKFVFDRLENIARKEEFPGNQQSFLVFQYVQTLLQDCLTLSPI